ncbi:hypothetical protein JCM2811A_05210 [Methylorubrum rhodinum]
MGVKRRPRLAGTPALFCGDLPQIRVPFWDFGASRRTYSHPSLRDNAQAGMTACFGRDALRGIEPRSFAFSSNATAVPRDIVASAQARPEVVFETPWKPWASIVGVRPHRAINID